MIILVCKMQSVKCSKWRYYLNYRSAGGDILDILNPPCKFYNKSLISHTIDHSVTFGRLRAMMAWPELCFPETIPHTNTQIGKNAAKKFKDTRKLNPGAGFMIYGQRMCCFVVSEVCSVSCSVPGTRYRVCEVPGPSVRVVNKGAITGDNVQTGDEARSYTWRQTHNAVYASPSLGKVGRPPDLSDYKSEQNTAAQLSSEHIKTLNEQEDVLKILLWSSKYGDLLMKYPNQDVKSLPV